MSLGADLDGWDSMAMRTLALIGESAGLRIILTYSAARISLSTNLGGIHPARTSRLFDAVELRQPVALSNPIRWNRSSLSTLEELTVHHTGYA